MIKKSLIAGMICAWLGNAYGPTSAAGQESQIKIVINESEEKQNLEGAQSEISRIKFEISDLLKGSAAARAKGELDQQKKQNFAQNYTALEAKLADLRVQEAKAKLALAVVEESKPLGDFPRTEMKNRIQASLEASNNLAIAQRNLKKASAVKDSLAIERVAFPPLGKEDPIPKPEESTKLPPRPIRGMPVAVKVTKEGPIPQASKVEPRPRRGRPVDTNGRPSSAPSLRRQPGG